MSKQTKSSPISNISPHCLIKAVLQNIWMVIASALICAMCASLYVTYFKKPVYNATMTYAVTSRKTSYTSGNNLTSAKEVAAIITELLESDVITESIRSSSERLADFNGTISASNIKESNFISVTATASTPESAFLALDALVELFPELSDYISDKSVVQVIRNPSVSGIPANSTNTSKLCLISASAGAVFMIMILIGISVKRETVQTRAGARNLLDAPIIASVCHERKYRTLKSFLLHRGSNNVKVFSPSTSFAYTEQINTVCAQIEHESTENNRRLFLIAGVGENEGKSTVAANIAVALSLKGKNVALVDGDLRNPSLNSFFDGRYKSALPLNQMLAEPFSWENLHHCMAKSDRFGVYMLFSHKSDVRSTELLTGDTMSTMLEQLRAFDCVIIDSPPMGFFPDAEALAELADASMLVVRQDYTPACDINDAIDTLRQSKSEFLGCILNDMTGYLGSGVSVGYGYGGRYGYGNKYGYGSKRQSKERSAQ